MATPSPMDLCIQELCEIADPGAVRKWFSRWIRSVESEIAYSDRESELRESLSKLGPNEPKSTDVRAAREQHAIYTTGISAVKEHGLTEWSYDSNLQQNTCRSTLFALSMKGPLNEEQ